MDKVEIIQVRKGDLIEIDEKSVYLLLNGKVVYQDHELDEPIAYKVVMVAKPGTWIGVKALDMGMSCLPTVFPVVYSHTAQLLKLSPATFSQLWHESQNIHDQVRLDVYDQFSLFRNLSVQTK